jgi:small-conductance mechanosensitive channel
MSMGFEWTSVVAGLVEFLRSNAAGLIVSLVGVWAIHRMVALLTERYVADEAKRLTVRKWSRYTALWLAFVWVLVVYGMHRQKDFFFLIGIFLAAVALSLRDVFSNLVGWLVVMTSGTYREGDRIRINNVTGDVIDVGLFRTLLAEIGEWVDADQSTGRLVAVPNSHVLSHPVYNYTAGHEYIWDELRVLVTFDSDWRRGEQIMLEAAQRDFAGKEEQVDERLRSARRRFHLTYTYVTPKVYVSIADSGVQLSVRYLVRARNRRTLRDAFSREVLERFAAEPQIALAYPSLAIYRPPTGPGPSLPPGAATS